ncbi:MAG: hypothetical protein AAFQ66_13400 [Pseudomonadota bacterium]
MPDEAQVGLPERRLATELAQLVAQKLWRDLGSEIHNGRIHNLGQSNYEEGCYALNLVGIYRQDGHYTLHEVIVAAEDVAAHMAALSAISQVAFDTLLSAFLVNYIEYEATLSDSREIFTVPAELQKVMELFTRCGYCDQQDGGYSWTLKIGPIMRKWYLWDERNQSYREAEHRARKERVVRLAQALPDLLHQRLKQLAQAGNEISAAMEMADHWDGTGWTFAKQESRWSTRKGELDTATVKALCQYLAKEP